MKEDRLTGTDRRDGSFGEAMNPLDATAPSLTETPGLVLVATGSRLRRFDRDDVVLRKGEYALINGTLTPRQSMIEDLVAVREVLEEAGIEFLLVRGDNDRLVIAIDRARRKQLYAREEARIHELVPAVFLYWQVAYSATNSDLKNYKPAQYISSNWNAWEWEL